jgi:hypothetical protein
MATIAFISRRTQRLPSYAEAQSLAILPPLGITGPKAFWLPEIVLVVVLVLELLPKSPAHLCKVLTAPADAKRQTVNAIRDSDFPFA